MASNDEGWDAENELAKLRPLGEGDLETNLDEAGCSKEAIAVICQLAKSHKRIDMELIRGNLSDNEQAVFLAVVGRANSIVTAVHLSTRMCSPQLTESAAAALCANLATNTNIKCLRFYNQQVFGTVKGCTLLGIALRTNSALRALSCSFMKMNDYAVKFLLDGLQENKTLVTFSLDCNTLADEGIKRVGEFVAGNRTLTRLDLDFDDSEFKGAKYLSSAFQRNTTLEALHLGTTSPFERGVLKTLLEPFSKDIRESSMALNTPKNTTIEALRLPSGLSSENVAEVNWMLRTNKSLTTLLLHQTTLEPKDWEDGIFSALKENQTLQELDLYGSEGLTGKDVEDALMDLTQSSKTGLTSVNLRGTSISDLQGRVDRELRINREYRARLRGQAYVPTTAGRLILCGFGYAGKTTICETMERICHKTPKSHFSSFWTKAMQVFPCLQRILFTKDDYGELASRTRGFNVVSLNTPDYCYLKSVWDFAGQKAYYALHDYLFPDTKNSCFLYVSSCRCVPTMRDREGAIKSQEKIKTECEFWLKFIASNSKPTLVGDKDEKELPYRGEKQLVDTDANEYLDKHEDRLQGRYQLDSDRKRLPQVKFVMTKRDTLTPAQLKISTQWAQHVVGDLKEVFKNVLELCEDVEVVNAHSEDHVGKLLTFTDDTLKEILKDQKEYAICEDVRKVLAGRPADNPVMSTADFFAMSEGRFNFNDSPSEIKEAVLNYLNDLGEVIHPEGFDFIVAEPRWFGVSILGSLIEGFKGVEDDDQQQGSHCADFFWLPMLSREELVHDGGFVDKKNLENVLKQSVQMTHLQQSIGPDQLINLMIHLELCFKEDPRNVNSRLFMPALFKDEDAAANGERKLEWKLVQNGPKHYLGRRLQCENKDTMFLTPGFFPRLQVHLRNHFHKNGWTGKRHFAVDRNLIRAAENGVEVLVEFCGEIDHFIDILVMSYQPHAKALKFIDEHVIKKIQDFCVLQKGCQGVKLVEAVIRKVCVRELHLCKDRKVHAVLISTLRSKLEKEGTDYRHTWPDAIHDQVDQDDTDLALDLLAGQGWQDSSVVRGISSSAASTSSHNDQFPTLFYLSIEDVGMLERFRIKLNLDRKMPFKLHLLCDHHKGYHKMENQPGRTVQLDWKMGGYDLPIINLAVGLLFANVGGVAGTFIKEAESSIQKLLSVSKLTGIDAETLQQTVNYPKTCGSNSELQILEALKNYWEADLDRKGLKKILNLEEGAEFKKDFGLHKVVYVESHGCKIGWVCNRHFVQGLMDGILKLVPY